MASMARIGRTINYGDVAASILGFSEEEYDVFINFRGEDTRRGIADHLYWSLKEAKIKVFRDDPSLPFGEEIQRELLAAIEETKIAIIIISEDYASSVYCLRELTHILKCKEARELMVMPIFYKVDPSDLRHLRNSFGRIQTHIIKYHGMEVESWKVALKYVGNMRGFLIDDTSYEGRTVSSIVKTVKIELENPRKMNSNRKPKKKKCMNCNRKTICRCNNDDLIVAIIATLVRCIFNLFLSIFEFCIFFVSVLAILSGFLADHLLPRILKPRRNVKRSKEVFKPILSMEEAATTPTQLDKQGYFPKGCILQFERIQTTTTVQGKESMVTSEDPWMSQYDIGESSNSRKLEGGTPEVSLQFNGMTGNTSMIGCNRMEAETSSSQPIAHLDRLFDEINSTLASPPYAMEEKLRYSTQLAIFLVDSFIKQINLSDAADVDFTSPTFLQLLESLRQPNALPEVPRALLMAFHSALTSFAGTPEYLDQIQSAKSTFSKCIRAQMAKEDEIQKLKFKLDMDKNALQETRREIASLENKSASLKAKARDLEAKLSGAIPTVISLSDELKRCKIQLVEAQVRLDSISTVEEHIKTNHHRVLHLLHEIKNLLERKTGNI